MLLRARPEKFEEYKKLHDAVYPEVLDMIKQCNISNYSAYHKNGFCLVTSNIASAISRRI